jgi:hypothetical protein
MTPSGKSEAQALLYRKSALLCARGRCSQQNAAKASVKLISAVRTLKAYSSAAH